MKDIIKERFSFDYENDSTSSYLVVNMDSNENILEYQIEMIANNSSSGILDLNTRYKNNEIKLYYNITSRLTLSQFLQRKKLNKTEFIDILMGITKILLDSKEYLLYDKSFLIDEEYIYINPGNLEMGMIYLPLDFNTDVSENFKAFLVNLIISLAKIEESSKGNYMQRILNYLKNDTFNIHDFNCLLKEVKNDKAQEIERQVLNPNQSNINSLNTKDRYVNQNKDIPSVKKSEKEKSNIHSISHRVRHIPKPSAREEEEIIVKKRYKLKYIFIAILSQILIVILVALGLDTIKSAAGDDISAYGGISLIVIALNALLFKNLFKKENMEEVKIAKKKKGEPKTIGNRKKGIVKGAPFSKPPLSQDNQNINMSKREIFNIKEARGVDEVEENVAAALEPVSFNINETTILEEKEGFAYLQRMSNGMMDNVTIANPNFIIGRLPNYVDYLIDSNSIGRTHAEILCREGQYFIKDLNSKNGTFINGVKIHSNREYDINSGDKIRFANIEYTFIYS